MENDRLLKTKDTKSKNNDLFFPIMHFSLGFLELYYLIRPTQHIVWNGLVLGF